ncbi:MAG: uroporphyrinogen decarboxylase [Armatimonadota bacterium]|nr:uroporphyrinogen decarboxylase [Armatimonadota bacterium]MDR7452342.1 uroporphyrinogen decarboxylase [Armatimonadota bacterium]MDR7466902.1 uroporphyrinogen decarboxylase [Armatimonadota bacterium]MDR7493556.1 uroporphyrinogen decarboxylase [Armatimonadota bacterium]MDR7498821.1 uroporphyrinogen decarboxylase [Armatimonadota bacterium]
MSRFLLACRRQPVDRTPVWFMRQAGRSQPGYRALRARYSLLEICRHSDLVAEVTLAPVEQLGVDAAILFADITVPLLGMGVAFDLREGSGPHIHRPVRDAADLERLHPFEPEETVHALLDAVRLIRRSAPVPLIGFAGAPFTLASYLIEGGPSREFLRTKALMREDRRLWDGLMTRLTEATTSFLRAQIAHGAQAVQLFDSWVGALSPREYAVYAAPYSRRIFEAVRETGVPAIHFGTGTSGLLREMASAGGDVIGVDWRIGLDVAWAQIGYDRAIQGNLDPSLLLASPEVLRAEAEDVLSRAAGRPGHIFNLGHGVLPETPQQRLRDLVEFVHAYRPAAVV